MEDLLASIRKAIQDDLAEPPASTTGRAAGTLVKGNVRELHVSASYDTPSSAAEIQEIRDRINRSRLEAPRHRGVETEAAPPLRPSYAEQDLRGPSSPRGELARRQDRDLERLARPATWREEEALRQASTWREEEPIRTRPAPEAWSRPEPAALVAPDVAEATGAAFHKLAESILSRATGERSIEDLTRDLLRGMLKQWLDDNLPSLVERLVREEIERVARRGR